MRSSLLTLGLLLTVSLAGCFGDDGDFEPGTDFKETGRTIHLRMWVADLVGYEVYPGFLANLWAFCAEAFDPNDQVSQDAIEYMQPLPSGSVTGGSADRCSVPGPTIRVQQGDRVIVEFQNDHFHCHTIHWHGQFVPWESDGVPGSTQDSVCAGESFTYEYIAKRAGSLWYHCHVDTQFHVMQGLFGMIIVEPQDKSLEPKDIDKEYVLVFHTFKRDLIEATPARLENPHVDHQHSPDSCGASGVPGCQNPAVDLTPDVFAINGNSFPNTVKRDDTLIRLGPDERIRLRVLNAGVTFETIHPHGHDLLITHLDGNPVPKEARVFRDSVEIGPGQRVDMVLEGREGNEGVWVMHTHVTSHVANDGQYPGGMLTKIVYPEYEDDIMPFPGGVELPGGQPYTPAVTLPSDVKKVQVIDLGTDQQASGTFDWTLTMPCAVKRIDLFVESASGSSATQVANDLMVMITDADGEQRGMIQLGNARSGNWTYEQNAAHTNLLPQGGMTAVISGTAIDTRATFDLFVDHFDRAEAERLGLCGLGSGSHDH